MKPIFLLAVALCGTAAPIPVLIVTGQSDIQYHDWRATTGLIEKHLASTNRFEIRRCEDPRGLMPEVLSQYKAVIVSYNGPRWGAPAESALASYVKNGGGLVTYHGVTYGPLMGTILRPNGGWDTAEPWAAWADMLGVTWAPKNIGHAPRGAFAVKSPGDHAITRDLAREFHVSDELYHKMTLRPGVRVIATAYDDAARGGTGKDEPMAWVNSYGSGRVFHTTLGHDTSALYNPVVLDLLTRATEWAATGEVTLIALNPPPPPVRALVVTGGHSYDPSFYTVFENMNQVRWSHATSQKEAFTSDMAKRWDVVVLYDMYNDIGEAERNNLRAFVEAGKGVVALHHSIVDYTSWPWWYEQVIGGKYFEKPVESHPASHYKEGVEMVVRVAPGKQGHPVVRGVGDIVTDDECYRGMWQAPGIEVLMETSNELNDRPVVYVGPNKNFRAVYIQLGHGTYTHLHPGYRKLVNNAILWAGGRLK